MYKLNDLIKHTKTIATEINGKWVPARPLNHKEEHWTIRLKDAWSVFRRKADAFTWPEGQ